jgi:hypothetical protein
VVAERLHAALGVFFVHTEQLTLRRDASAEGGDRA